jgi:hypothetical protein
MSYRKIKTLLFDDYDLKTSHSNIANFVKVRSKRPRKMIRMLPPSSTPVPAPPPVGPTLLDESLDAWAKIEALKNKPVNSVKNPFYPDLSKPLTLN